MGQTKPRKAARPAGRATATPRPTSPSTVDIDIRRPDKPEPVAVHQTCRCQRMHLGKLVAGGRPVTVATFRDQRLVAVVRRHWAVRDGCAMPDEHIDPAVYWVRP